MVTKLWFMKLGNCFSKFVNQSSSFPELFLDLTTTEPEPELFSFCHFGGARARAGKARQARLELEPRSGSLDISAQFGIVIISPLHSTLLGTKKSLKNLEWKIIDSINHGYY